MYEFLKPTVNEGDCLIIGLGDSYTQGVGAYSDQTWLANKGKIPIDTTDHALLREQFEGSWVNQLANMMPGWKAYNLGHSGTGNRAAVKELYFHQAELDKADRAIVVFLLSGFERFDFVQRELAGEHTHFESMWPNFKDPNSHRPDLWKAYAEHLYSERFIATELLLTLFELQNYCRLKDYELVVASAFDMRFNKKWFNKVYDPGMFNHSKCAVGEDFVNQFDWEQVLYPRGYRSFIELLVKLEGFDDDMAAGKWYPHYSALEFPSRYITNCTHPTRRGHEIIAMELFKFIKEKQWVI